MPVRSRPPRRRDVAQRDGPGRRAGRRPRRAGAPACGRGASTRVFQSPQPAQRPDQPSASWPHALQKKEVVARAMRAQPTDGAPTKQGRLGGRSRCRLSGGGRLGDDRSAGWAPTEPASGFGGGAPWLRERIATPASAAASESTVTTIPIGVSAIVSSNSVMPSTTEAIGSKAMLVAIAGASTPVCSDSWLSVIEA